MKIFLTGASGFIGSAVLKDLVQKGHDVTGLVRRKAKADAVEQAGASVIVGDLLEPDPWTVELGDSDIVISTSQPFRHDEKITLAEARRRSYYHGQMVGNLFTRAQDTRVKGVVVTYGVLGFGDKGTGWATEDSDISPLGYERSVSGAFWHINKTSRKSKVPLISLFTGLVYGQGSWFEAMVRGLKNGSYRMVGEGANYMSLIHIDDLVAAYSAVVDKMPFGSRYCLADGNPVKQRDFARFVASQLGLPAPESMDVAGYSKRAGELAAETMTCSVRVSAERMKKLLLPELKYPTYKSGVPAILKTAAPAVKGVVALRQASGF